MSESPENKNVPITTQQTQTPAADPNALINLAEAARPIINDLIRGEQDKARQEQEHEFRMTELEGHGFGRTRSAELEPGE